MIKEIESLRRKGMSFRKIAESLNSTVGKVHYQWIKHSNNNSSIVKTVQVEERIKSEQMRPVQKGNFLKLSLTDDQKLASNWKIAKWQKELVGSYFNGEINQSVILLRIYDVSDIYFNGSNAHSCFEFQLPENKTYWVVKGIKQERTYLTEIGYNTKHNHFFPVLRSNAVHVGLKQEEKEIVFKEKVVNKHDISENQPKWTEKVSTYSYYENINEVN
jgi:uncharacterized protein